jgi:hypothetical protein
MFQLGSSGVIWEEHHRPTDAVNMSQQLQNLPHKPEQTKGSRRQAPETTIPRYHLSSSLCFGLDQDSIGHEMPENSPW